jgi:hypothetical protein
MMENSESIIVHYHLFKNAGTSVDHLLKRNFGDQWMGFDGESAGSVITTEELEKTISGAPEKLVFSSHQIVPPLPDVGKAIYPIVFLRDPIDRIKSAYLFEWKKQLGLDEPKGSLKEFVEHKFKFKRKSSVEEFQTIRLANNQRADFNSNNLSDDELIQCASEFIQSLSFVGVVDEFDRSMELLQSYLAPAFPQFALAEVKANVLQDIATPMDRKRGNIREELGDELFEMIVERNTLDEQLYQVGRAHFNALAEMPERSIA